MCDLSINSVITKKKEMMEMVVKGNGKTQFGSEKITPTEYIERMTNATSGPDETTGTTTSNATMSMKATNALSGADATTGTTATNTTKGTKAATKSEDALSRQFGSGQHAMRRSWRRKR